MLSFVLWGDPSYLFDCQSLNPPVLVFVQSKDRAKELFKELAFDDIKADVVHADLSQMQVKLQFVLSWWFGSTKCLTYIASSLVMLIVVVQYFWSNGNGLFVTCAAR